MMEKEEGKEEKNKEIGGEEDPASGESSTVER